MTGFSLGRGGFFEPLAVVLSDSYLNEPRVPVLARFECLLM